MQTPTSSDCEPTPTSLCWDLSVATQRAILLVNATIPSNCKLLNLYRWGSRWWGNSCCSSDWDFLAVVGNEYLQPADGNVAQQENLDVAIITLSNFQKSLDQHVPWVLPFLFYPPEGILQEEYKFKNQEIEIMKLRRALFTNQEVNLRQAKTLWRDADYYRAKKRVFVVFQMINFSIQILQKGTVYDRYQPNHYFNQFLNFHEEEVNFEWSEFQSTWEFQKECDLAEFNQFVQKVFTWEERIVQEGKGSITQKFILEFTEPSLRTLLSVYMTDCADFPNLLHLMHSLEYTPWISKVGKECSGLILDRDNDYKVVCYPLHRLDDHEYEHAPKINWSRATDLIFFEWYDGYTITMYFYNGKWHVGSQKSPDGSHKLMCYPDCDERTESELFWELFTKKGWSLPDIYTIVLHMDDDKKRVAPLCLLRRRRSRSSVCLRFGDTTRGGIRYDKNEIFLEYCKTRRFYRKKTHTCRRCDFYFGNS
eukprot:TRINITY_DN3152_c0_g1_i1.p1 TRINITY_DN3152_c0_g1~~TRINITY_DN3152_c0_g1_i1.p1  ORF type:complete len:479 (-),score=78.61 TRINITY_DN3152_c0_g1_i1:241-1677(-)